MAAAAVVKEFDPGHGSLNAALTASLRDKAATASLEYKHHIAKNLSAFAVAAAQYSPRGFDASGSLGLSYQW